MSFNGYFSFGGTEIINTERTEKYAINAGVTGFTAQYKNTDIHRALGDAPYSLPFQDVDVPWGDPNVPAANRFFGCYPIDITGLESSTRTSTAIENISDGGTPGRVRNATREIVFNVLLIAADDAGADYGMNWLKAALQAGQGGDCGDLDGATLCFFASQPVIDDTATYDQAYDCGNELARSMYRCVVTNGPTVNSRRYGPVSGTALWDVTFTVTCGIPWQFGIAAPVLDRWLDPTSAIQNIGAGAVNSSGYTWVNRGCYQPTFVPVFDPACPDLILPPSLPQNPLGCFDPPANWKRRTFDIPSKFSSVWMESVPIIQIATKPGKPVRNLRIRIYADPDGTFDPDVHYCSFCADYLITYIPDDGLLTIDGRYETVTFAQSGQARRADSLVMSSIGMPLDWPRLACGIGYTATVDSLQTQSMPAISFDLTPKSS